MTCYKNKGADPKPAERRLNSKSTDSTCL